MRTVAHAKGPLDGKPTTFAQLRLEVVSPPMAELLP